VVDATSILVVTANDLMMLVTGLMWGRGLLERIWCPPRPPIKPKPAWDPEATRALR